MNGVPMPPNIANPGANITALFHTVHLGRVLSPVLMQSWNDIARLPCVSFFALLVCQMSSKMAYTNVSKSQKTSVKSMLR